MITNFYDRYSRLILGFVAITFIPLWIFSERIVTNNDIETWMPRDTDVRQTYEEFKQDFGAEEVIVVGLPKSKATRQIVEAFAGRLDRLTGIRKTWTVDRMVARMKEFGVPDEDGEKRLEGLLQSDGGSLVGIVATLSEQGIRNRSKTAADVKATIEYCQFDPDECALTGAPVIITELDRLGSSKSNKRFFLMTCAISLGLLYYSFGHLGFSLATLAVTIWGIFLNQAAMAACGGEMNFILGSLPIMVMIFTLSISIHVVSYHSSAKVRGDKAPLDSAIRESLNPCFLSTLTTLLGLVSLNVSSILPVSQFGYAAASGSIVALIVGMGVTPALLTAMPCEIKRCASIEFDFVSWGAVIARNRVKILAATFLALAGTGMGLMRLCPDINPTEFLPKNSKVLTDLNRIEAEITNVDSIEAIVDFHGQKLPFLDQLHKVRQIESKIAAHHAIRHALSLATFFPEEMPDSALATARILGQAQSYSGEEGFVADQQRLWRISARIRHDTGRTSVEVLSDLVANLEGEPVHFTGMAPLLKNAQQEIFDGFWKSFTAACLTIFIVMVVSLRSFVAGTIAMIPNIIPIWFVFGLVGFASFPVDIGMMMTGSIALGISVDCTFHFLVHYQQAYKKLGSAIRACQEALQHSGEPMLDSTMVSSFGLLALCMSSFTPTARFGLLMAAQMAASLLGELVILPAILCCCPDRKVAQVKSNDATMKTPSSVEGEPVPHTHPFPQGQLRKRRRVKNYRV